MVASNSLNIKETGFQSFDGSSVFKGRTYQAGTGITITNADGVDGDPVFTATGTVTGGQYVSYSDPIENIDFTQIQTIAVYTPPSDFILNSMVLICDTNTGTPDGITATLGTNSPNYDNMLSNNSYTLNGVDATVTTFSSFSTLVPAGTPIVLNITAGDTATTSTGRVYLTGELMDGAPSGGGNVNPVAFSAYLSTPTSNDTGDGTQAVVICDTVLTNVGSGYDNTTGTFTCPTNGDGNYQFNFSITWNGIVNSAATSCYAGAIGTPYEFWGLNFSNLTAPVTSPATISFSCLLPMIAGQTINMKGMILGTTKSIGFYGSPVTGVGQPCMFSGVRVSDSVNYTGKGFFAYANANIPNVIGSSGLYTPLFNSTSRNDFNGYDSTTGTFTAFATGLYSFQSIINMANVLDSTDLANGYTGSVQSAVLASFGAGAINPFQGCIINNAWTMQMNAGDTIHLTVFSNESTTTVTLGGSPIGSAVYTGQSSFSGFYLSA